MEVFGEVSAALQDASERGDGRDLLGQPDREVGAIRLLLAIAVVTEYSGSGLAKVFFAPNDAARAFHDALFDSRITWPESVLESVARFREIVRESSGESPALFSVDQMRTLLGNETVIGPVALTKAIDEVKYEMPPVMQSEASVRQGPDDATRNIGAVVQALPGEFGLSVSMTEGGGKIETSHNGTVWVSEGTPGHDYALSVDGEGNVLEAESQVSGQQVTSYSSSRPSGKSKRVKKAEEFGVAQVLARFLSQETGQTVIAEIDEAEQTADVRVGKCEVQVSRLDLPDFYKDAQSGHGELRGNSSSLAKIVDDTISAKEEMHYTDSKKVVLLLDGSFIPFTSEVMSEAVRELRSIRAESTFASVFLASRVNDYCQHLLGREPSQLV